jgi:hypothetical protein
VNATDKRTNERTRKDGNKIAGSSKQQSRHHCWKFVGLVIAIRQANLLTAGLPKTTNYGHRQSPMLLIVHNGTRSLGIFYLGFFLFFLTGTCNPSDLD